MSSTKPQTPRGSSAAGVQPPASAPNAIEAMANAKAPGLIAEFWMFLTENKKWWLLPIVVVMLVLGGLVILSSTPLAPFIYTLF